MQFVFKSTRYYNIKITADIVMLILYYVIIHKYINNNLIAHNQAVLYTEKRYGAAHNKRFCVGSCLTLLNVY
jgi:hypothetical protein